MHEEHASGGNRARPVLARVNGTPGLRARDPAALRKARLARQDGYMERLDAGARLGAACSGRMLLDRLRKLGPLALS